MQLRCHITSSCLMTFTSIIYAKLIAKPKRAPTITWYLTSVLFCKKYLFIRAKKTHLQTKIGIIITIYSLVFTILILSRRLSSNTGYLVHFQLVKIAIIYQKPACQRNRRTRITLKSHGNISV